MIKFGHKWRKLKADRNTWHGWELRGGYFAPEGFYLLISGVNEGLGFENNELEEDGEDKKR